MMDMDTGIAEVQACTCFRLLLYTGFTHLLSSASGEQVSQHKHSSRERSPRTKQCDLGEPRVHTQENVHRADTDYDRDAGPGLCVLYHRLFYQKQNLRRGG